MKFKKMEDHEILKEEMDQDMMDRKKRRAGWYRKYADLDESATIDMNNLDEWALSAAGCEGRCSVEDIKEALQESVLVEDSTADLKGTLKQAADQLNADQYVDDSKMSRTEIEQVLDESLDAALDVAGEEGEDYPNVIFISESGAGKTSICRAWAKKNNVNLVEIRTSAIDPTDIGGLFTTPDKDADQARKVKTGMFAPLTLPRSVLFLDEYNRGTKQARNSLLEFINSHYIPNPNHLEGGQEFFPNFLFTIATINPPTGDYNADKIDPAETSRFRKVMVSASPAATRTHLLQNLDSKIAKWKKEGNETKVLRDEGRKKLVDTILSSKRFTFDDRDDLVKGDDKYDFLFQPLNPRTFAMLIKACDGTKKDLLRKWNEFCNPDKKSTIEGILDKYVDIEDKANDALKGGTESDVFKKRVSPLDKLKAKYTELNI